MAFVSAFVSTMTLSNILAHIFATVQGGTLLKDSRRFALGNQTCMMHLQRPDVTQEAHVT